MNKACIYLSTMFTVIVLTHFIVQTKPSCLDLLAGLEDPPGSLLVKSYLCELIPAGEENVAETSRFLQSDVFVI